MRLKKRLKKRLRPCDRVSPSLVIFFYFVTLMELGQSPKELLKLLKLLKVPGQNAGHPAFFPGVGGLQCLVGGLV